ncbi:hypothetical protein DFH11DRAFT_1743020 [Phellopilus nigrolimitatus]|nr:hypothetical protein DFH11DRAFT_1743020 [Phellopilus nigrolimitatus]
MRIELVYVTPAFGPCGKTQIKPDVESALGHFESQIYTGMQKCTDNRETVYALFCVPRSPLSGALNAAVDDDSFETKGTARLDTLCVQLRGWRASTRRTAELSALQIKNATGFAKQEAHKMLDTKD